jgi:hypothetical protein
MIESLRRLFGLTPPAAPTGAAWRSYPVTPQSLVTQPVGVDRQIGGVGEIGMGGPNYWTMLLADGAMLGGVCGGVSDVGRLRVALTLTRQGETLQVYDPDAQVIHTLDPAPRTANDEAWRREACRRAVRSVALRSVRGLRLEDAVEPPERLTLTLPSGRTLEARLVLPDDLRGTVEVEGLLRDPPYGLWLDGAATGLHVADLDEVVEAADGQIVLRGRRLDADGRVIDGMWLARRDGRWGALLGHAFEPLVGGGGRTPYFLSDPRFDDQDRMSFQLRTFGWGPDGELPSQPAPPLVELAVSWRNSPLFLRPRANRISLRVP